MAGIVGQPLDRVDGRAKVTGTALYTGDRTLPGLAHGVIVGSAIAHGHVVAIDATAAARVAGVRLVLSHANAPRLPGGVGRDRDGNHAILALQDRVIRYANQPIAVVVAETIEQAREGARRLLISYAEKPPATGLERAGARALRPKEVSEEEPDTSRGNVKAALADSDTWIEETYTTAMYTHNPLEPHATVAAWDGGSLTLYDTTQGLFDCQARVARIFGLPTQAVRVVSTYLGGGFGSKGPVWSHVILAAMAARQLGRPVKLVLARTQMFGPVGSRSRTRQTVALGATPDGGLRVLRHDTLAETSTFDDYMEACGLPARTLYAAAARATSHRFVRSNIGTPSYMRAPGWAPGTFALECAIDELAEALRMDPVALRVRNHAARHPRSRRPWSSNELRACYQLGAARFGWSGRPTEPGRWRRGQWRIGWGVAGSLYPVHQSPASARVRLREDGSLHVETGSQDIGTGTYTILTQIAAEAFGVRPADVTLQLGDTEYPETPMSGGSQTAVSAGVAVQKAAAALRRKVVRLAIADPAGPLHRARLEAVIIDAGRIFDSRNGGRGESLRALLARQKRPSLDARAHAEPGSGLTRYAAYAFGAQFAEVHVDADLGRVRVARMVGVFDAGRVLNAKTARSQLIGGMVGGIGMALHEGTELDERLGRVVNADLGEYHVPVQADVPEIDVSWIGTPDERANPLGAKGIGELGITGAAAAIANAVFHATRRRVRDLPIRLDRLL